METKEPIYLTKNGSAAVVLLDAEEYDRYVKACESAHREYVLASVALGRMQHEIGMSLPWDEVKQHLREKWGSDVFDD